MPRHRQKSGLSCLKIDPLAAWFEPLENDVGRCKCGMAAKDCLDLGREPADVIAIARAHEERRLGKIVFRSDRLHLSFGQPAVKRHHRGRISAEELVGERVDLIKGETHVVRPDAQSVILPSI